MKIRGVTQETAKRYIRRFGGEIAYITLMTKDGFFDTLRDKHGKRLAAILKD